MGAIQGAGAAPARTDPEAAVRAVIGRRLRLARVPAIPGWDDQAVADILAVFREAPGSEDSEAAAVAAEMLAVFKPGSNGCTARVSAAQVDDWRERLGQQ